MNATPAVAAASRLWHEALDTINAIGQFALPQRCPGCGEPAEASRLLCASCCERVPRLSFAVCARCLAREREGFGCGRHPGFQVWPAWVYDERAALIVHALKYAARPGLAGGLGVELARAVPPAPRWDLVAAVPLHPARERERGYNQAARLAESLADAIGTPYVNRVVERVRPTAPQARMDARARRRNLTGAFAVRHAQRVAGRRVLLVDDVVTTGATLEACLAALERAGATASAATLAWAQ